MQYFQSLAYNHSPLTATSTAIVKEVAQLMTEPKK
jgi:CBS domain-containing protein